MKRQKKKKKKQKPILAPTKCINCGEKGAHFVGPSFGDKGFFICEKILTKLEKMEKEKKDAKQFQTVTNKGDLYKCGSSYEDIMKDPT